MAGKIPDDAFNYYQSLGPARSYEAVAEKYDVSKKAVVKRALKEKWQERLSTIERAAREASDRKASESIEAMNERHLRYLRGIQGKAVEALRQMPISSGMDAVRALTIAIREERVARGGPSDRTAVSVEEVIRREYTNWMAVDGSSENGKEKREGDGDG